MEENPTYCAAQLIGDYFVSKHGFPQATADTFLGHQVQGIILERGSLLRLKRQNYAEKEG